ncbi:MAG TPA: sterol desaturase family protein [Nitrospirota bacterium]|nr:sterol desaturase family protein [Nitrospirota bacterium]
MDTKLLLIITAVALIFALEGVFPHYRDRAARVRHAVPHFITAIMNGLLTRFFLAGLTIAALAWAESKSLGLAHMLSLPATAKLIFVFVLFDIWMYFWHMANHRIGFFWRFHRAHHSDTEMDTTTALRFHPGELVLSTFFRLPIVILIGMSFSQLVLFEVVLNVSTLFHHSNLAVPEKWDRMLRTVIVTPNMHRVHHSVELSETNSNFTSLLSVWDRLFRSFRTREDTHTITIGLPSFRETKYQRLWGFLITPLR